MAANGLIMVVVVMCILQYRTDGVDVDDDDECKNSQRMLMSRGETKCININYSGPKMASLCVGRGQAVEVVVAAAVAVEWNNAI